MQLPLKHPIFKILSGIQLNDAFAEVSEIQDYIIAERSSMKESDQAMMTVSLKIDKDTKMGIVK